MFRAPSMGSRVTPRSRLRVSPSARPVRRRRAFQRLRREARWPRRWWCWPALRARGPRSGARGRNAGDRGRAGPSASNVLRPRAPDEPRWRGPAPASDAGRTPRRRARARRRRCDAVSLLAPMTKTTSPEGKREPRRGSSRSRPGKMGLGARLDPGVQRGQRRHGRRERLKEGRGAHACDGVRPEEPPHDDARSASCRSRSGGVEVSAGRPSPRRSCANAVNQSVHRASNPKAKQRRIDGSAGRRTESAQTESGTATKLPIRRTARKRRPPIAPSPARGIRRNVAKSVAARTGQRAEASRDPNEGATSAGIARARWRAHGPTPARAGSIRGS